MLYFLSISLVAALLFLASLFFGDHGDMGDALVADHHGGADSVFSVRSLLLFCIGFGASGTIVRAYGLPTEAAVIAGMLFGAVAIVAGLRASQFFQQQESDSTLRHDDLLNRTGRVTLLVPEGGCGEVLVQDRQGRYTYLRAYSDAAVPSDTPVMIVGFVGDAVRVARTFGAKER
jgi:membrane protein implicated in regulation of membrane protease activity